MHEHNVNNVRQKQENKDKHIYTVENLHHLKGKEFQEGDHTLNSTGWLLLSVT